MEKTTTRCDIFCNVIDNFGDIGVCWRLARQLANEHGLAVRLWVDDLASLVKLCPEADATLAIQHRRGVEVRRWYEPDSPFALRYRRVSGEEPGQLRPSMPQEARDMLRYLSPNGDEEAIQPADLVIEAFACKLPRSYIEAMAAQDHKPIWINLEYLSAEDWVESHHKLPSPHPFLSLTRYFFFPGFTGRTGGLLLERDLPARRDAFQNDAAQQQAFWRSFGVEMPAPETVKISLFGYENAALPGLFDAWAASAQPILCLVPEGSILAQAGQYFGDRAPCAGSDYARGNLRVRVLPFVEQERYDELLWACDVNFVRGEDSFVRAQWAVKPFIWQIYPQHDAVHLKKLDAFLMLYGERLSRPASRAVEGLWRAWNSGDMNTQPLTRGGREGFSQDSDAAGQAASTGSGQAWPAFVAARGELERHARLWAQQLIENNLALNILDFSREIGRMRALKIEGQ